MREETVAAIAAKIASRIHGIIHRAKEREIF